jgi:hypothetical protein
MAEQMTSEQIQFQERMNTGTSWTRNKQFDKDGYFIIENLWDPEKLYHPLPEVRGQLNYWDNNVENFNHTEVEQQVEGSLARYWHPQYRQIHTGIRLKLERIIGRKLYNTYYYDRFYFPGQELTPHADRGACEISVSVHISTNLEDKDADWPFWIKSSTGEVRSISLEPGDGLLYKGCERPHWRDPMPGVRKRDRIPFLKKTNPYYYHQIFFHYVLQDGQRAHCAWDRAR